MVTESVSTSKRRSTANARPSSRDEIRDAFIRHVAESGYDGTNFGSIADELGISKGTIVHHFGTKERLLDEAVADARLVPDIERAGGVDALVGHRGPDPAVVRLRGHLVEDLLVALVLAVGRPVMTALRRASRRAAFEARGEFVD